MLSTYDAHRRLQTWEIRKICTCHELFISCVQMTRHLNCDTCEPIEADICTRTPAEIRDRERQARERAL
jgi:hypothetical protein